MNAGNHNFPLGALARQPQLRPDRVLAPMLAMRWSALADAGAVTAMLAGATDGAAHLPIKAALGALTGWRGQMVDARLASLSATMEAGLAALLEMRQQGHDPRPAAEALWREFAEARAGIAAMLEDA